MHTKKVADLCCGVGGASVGYSLAGFEVVGVDIHPQKDYPFQFVLSDALTFDVAGFDFVHASVPCHAYTTLAAGTNQNVYREYPKLIAAMRRKLTDSGIPFVLENVMSAPLRKDLVLCGEMFGLEVIRHRKFEFGNMEPPTQPAHIPHRGLIQGYNHGRWQDGPYFQVYGNGGNKGTTGEWRRAMGIDWTWDRHAISQAIPPAYTEWIGLAVTQALDRLNPFGSSGPETPEGKRS